MLLRTIVCLKCWQGWKGVATCTFGFAVLHLHPRYGQLDQPREEERCARDRNGAVRKP